MGNICDARQIPKELPESDELQFFLKLGVRWVEVAVAELQRKTNLTLSLKEPSTLSWRSYFATFKGIKELIYTSSAEQERKYWHPATNGYFMGKRTIEDEAEAEKDDGPARVGPADNFTNDEASEDEDSLSTRSVPQESMNLSSKPRALPRSLNAEYTNPIFFGYTTEREAAHKERIKQIDAAAKEREQRALSKAMAARSSVADAMEKKAQQQHTYREKKIADLQTSYEAEKKRRDDEYNEGVGKLEGEFLRLIKDQKRKEDTQAEQAFKRELLEQVARHEEKSSVDRAAIKDKRDELEAFKDLEMQETPAAERLEQFSRLEIHRCGEELRKAMGELARLQREFEAIRAEYDERLEANALQETKKVDKRLMELRSMANVAETRLREGQNVTSARLEDLLDANALLSKAVKEKEQQREFFPLFNLNLIPDRFPLLCDSRALVVAAVVMCSGTFDEKLNFLIRIFGADFSGAYHFDFVLALGTVVANVLKTLHLVPPTLSTFEVEALLQRIFSSFDLRPGVDALSDYEAKALFRLLLSKSELLMKLFRITVVRGEGARVAEACYSTYQLNQMAALNAYTSGLLDLPSCMDRLHYSQLQERVLLSAPRKRTIHERALSMGLNDPLAADYSHFFIKAEKKSSYRVDPLNTGVYTHVEHFLKKRRQEAAVKIQSIARLYLDKKLSERAAKQMALMEAKATAVKELKARILREYQKREAARGMGKMKWDAEVRMRQAKLRALGQAVSRSDVVMIMVEEAITVANKSLDDKFKELQLEDDSKTLKLLQPKELRLNMTFSPTLFDLRDESTATIRLIEGDPESAPATSGGLVPEESTKEIANPETNDDALAMQTSTPEPATSSVLPDAARVLDLLRGKTLVPLLGEDEDRSPDGDASGGSTEKTYKRGETSFEGQLRRVLSNAEPRLLEYLFRRLRLLDKVMTEFKAGELLAEMPAKRLLLKYITCNDLGFIQDDLAKHFKLKKHPKRIAQYLRNLERTDAEFGLLRRHVVALQCRVERGLLESYHKALAVSVASFRDAMELRRDSNTEGKTLQDFTRDELARLSTAAAGHQLEYSKVVASLAFERDKAQRLSLSLDHCQRLLVTVKEFGQTRGLLNPALPASVRFDWMGRYNDAVRVSTSSKLPVLSELSSLLTEFLDVARNDAVILIHDMFLPDHARSIPVHSTKPVNGRAGACGRGILGQKPWFSAHNIFYRVALDYDGVFNGSDEFAAKAASAERIASLEFMNASVDRLVAPLVATIDYFGFRVLAVARLPVQHVVFDDNGEVQRVSEDLVHGMTSQGDFFTNRSKLADKLLRLAAVKMNVAEHNVRGLRDLSSAATSASGLVKVFRGSDDRFYLRNCAAVLPCEPPSATAHLFDAPRHQSIFWRRLRPEYVRTLKAPLSSDAHTVLVNGTSDASRHHDVHRAAVAVLLGTTLPTFVKALLTRQYHLPLAEGLGINLSEEMHLRGISVRHMGLMRSLIWRALPGTVNVYNGEKFMRTSHNLSVEVEDGQQVTVGDLVFTVQATKRNPITTSTLPISHKHRVDSINSATAYCGEVGHSQNCEEIRLVLLGEMVARCIKNMIRFQLRAYNETNHGCSLQFLRGLVAEHLSFLTGASTGTAVLFEDLVYESMLERFGKFAIRISERKSLCKTLKPVLMFVIHRVVDMVGVRLASSTLAALAIEPWGFSFCLQDVVEVLPVVRHNVSVFSFTEAMMIAREAEGYMARLFSNEVLADGPSAFFNLSERKGGRLSVNHGRLGGSYNATISAGCDLEQAGPVRSDRFVRAIAFHPLQKACVDCNHHDAIVPSSIAAHFSMELFFRCIGGKDTMRVIVDNGRYRLGLARDNALFLTFYEGLHSLSFRCCVIETSGWYHVVVTFDGTFVRCFVNTDLKIEVEVTPLLAQRDALLMDQHQLKLHAIAADEVDERARLKEKTVRDSATFFQTKDGLAALKRISTRLVEVDGFNPEDQNEADEPLTGKQKRGIIVRKAKDEYIETQFEKNKVELSERFKELIADEEDHFRKQLQNGRLRVLKPFRVGGALPDANNRDGSDYFHGHISCVSIYDRCLPVDRIRAHYLAAQRQTHVDAQRLHARAAAKFMKAFTSTFSHGLFDSETEMQFLETFARSLCSFLYLDAEVRNPVDVDAAKTQLLDLLVVLTAKQLPDVIASIIKAIPRDPEFADIVVESLLRLRAIQRHYLSTSLVLPRDAVAFLPFELALIAPFRPFKYYEAAAFVFQEVVRDHNFGFIYGQVDLSWINEISSPLLVISIVKNTYEDRELKVVRLMELMSTQRMMGHAGLPSDSDVQALVQNSPLLEGFDFTNCSLLSDSSLEYLNRINSVRSLNLTRCTELTNKGIVRMSAVLPKLERLSLEGVVQLTDEGVMFIAENCHKLAHFNLNGCSEVTIVPVLQVVRHNRFLTHLHLARVQIIDEGMVDLAALLQHLKLVELNLSYCSAITDVGVAAISETCPSLRSLHLTGLNRVSFRSVQLITIRCWEMHTLGLEDVFLLNDKAFLYEAAVDGRAAANERMLVGMKNLAFTECLALTDAGMHYLAERCRALERLSLRGCAKLTDQTLRHFSDETLCSSSKFAMAATITALDLSFCTQFTKRGLEDVLATCQSLSELDLSGLVNVVDDQCVRMIGHTSPTIQSLKLRQCLLLTDLALCHIAETLWLEAVDVSGCPRLTDRGIEVAAEALSGLQSLGINKLKLVTTRAVRFLQQSCKGLRLLQCQDCPLISFDDVDVDQWNFEIIR